MAQTAQIPSNGNSPFAELPPIFTSLAEAKVKIGLTYEQIAQAIGKDEAWVAGAFYGQARFTPNEIDILSNLLDLEKTLLYDGIGAHWYPTRGLGAFPPRDPTVYRLFEGILVYGHPIKALINEKFGDGIMSMIDCQISVQKKENPHGDRVLLTFDGKFLPYKIW